VDKERKTHLAKSLYYPEKKAKQGQMNRMALTPVTQSGHWHKLVWHSAVNVTMR
jgi:hypothetical protein